MYFINFLFIICLHFLEQTKCLFLYNFIKIILTCILYHLLVDFVVIISTVNFHLEEFTRTCSFWIRTVYICVCVQVYVLVSSSFSLCGHLLCQFGLKLPILTTPKLSRTLGLIMYFEVPFQDIMVLFRYTHWVLYVWLRS